MCINNIYQKAADDAPEVATDSSGPIAISVDKEAVEPEGLALYSCGLPGKAWLGIFGIIVVILALSLGVGLGVGLRKAAASQPEEVARPTRFENPPLTSGFVKSTCI